MADIATKITKLDAQIVKLKKRIAEDTDKCEQLCQEKALLFYELFCKQYRCEGQELADMLALEHERAALLGTDVKTATDNSSADDDTDSVEDEADTDDDDSTDDDADEDDADDNDSTNDDVDAVDDDNSDNADEEAYGQTSFFTEKKNPYAV